MSKHMNQSRQAVMPACFRVLLWMSVMTLHANPEEEVENNVWTSVDGRKMQAQGLAWTPRGVLVKKPGQKDAVLVPYDSLQADDVSRAVNSLPFDRNEDVIVKVPVAEKTQKIDKQLVGYTDRSFAVDEKGERTGFLTKKPKPNYTYTNLSGYNLQVQLKSNSDPCVAWVEVHGLYQSEDKKTHSIHQERRIVEIQREASTCNFSCPPKQWFDGWVVLCRSLKTGKIIAMASSGWQYDGYAREKLSYPSHWSDGKESNNLEREPLKVKPPEEYREKILEDLKLRKTE